MYCSSKSCSKTDLLSSSNESNRFSSSSMVNFNSETDCCSISLKRWYDNGICRLFTRKSVNNTDKLYFWRFGYLKRADSGFPVGRGANSSGAPTYDFAKFSEKLHEFERILGRGNEGWGRSATVKFTGKLH